MEITITLGKETLEFLGNAIAKLEALSTAPKVQGKAPVAEAKAEVASKKTTKKAAEPEENFDLGASEAGDDSEPEDKVITKAELIKACASNRTKAITVLKRLKLESVHALKPGQYSRFMEEIGA